MATYQRPLPGTQPRRQDELSERITHLSWQRLADRSAPLPENISLDQLFDYFKGLRQVQMIDGGELDSWPQR